MADIKIITSTPVPGSAPQPAAAASAPAALKPAALASPAAPVPLTATPAPQAPSSFKDIFNKTEAKAAGPKMLETITGAKTSVADKLKPILGSSPQLKKTLEQEKQHREKRMLRTSQVVFVISLLLALGSVFYFYSELTPTFNLFGENSAAKLELINTNIHSLKATVNKYRYLAAQLDMNSFSYAAEQYLDKTAKSDDPNVSATDKAVLEKEITDLQSSLPAIFESLRKNLTQDITATTYSLDTSVVPDEAATRALFEDELRASLQQYRDELTAGAAGGAVSRQDLKLVDNAIKLVGNNTLIGTLKGTSVENFRNDLSAYVTSRDPLMRSKLQAFFTSILSSTSSDIASIGAIKAGRINWSELIKQVETVTTEVDPNFGKGLYNQLGGITYNTYTFDQQSGKIALSGETRTTDASNFTLISNLIEKFEESQYFKDPEMRAFSKSGTSEQGYTASFSLNLSLESGGGSPKNKTVSLGKDMLKARTGLKKVRRTP
jgi:hypothetical protein